MANRGRPKGDLYSKYVTAFNKAKKTMKRSMYDGQMLTKAEFNLYTSGSSKSDKETIKEIMDRHKYGRVSKEIAGRRDFYQSTLKKNYPNLKWNDIKYMSHEDFVNKYSNEISDIYNDYLNSGYASGDIKQLISQYIFGSE